jgi:SAM-dependent methyltransferase
VADWLADLLREDARVGVRREEGGVATVLAPEEDVGAGRFEGLYGGLYDRAIQTDVLRRLAFLAFGDARPVYDLDGLAKRVATGAHAVRGRSPVLLDIPSGGGTLLPRLYRCGYRGRVIESDLGTAMLERAAQLADRTPLDVALLRADAQDLPLSDGSVDAVVSLNGLHIIPDPRAFLMELGRVLRPRGRLWLVTLVSGGTRRADAVIRVGELTGIMPGPPPTRATLLRWLGDAGFASVAPLGGTGLLGVAATRR